MLKRLGTAEKAPLWSVGTALLALLALVIGLTVIGASMALVLLPTAAYAPLLGWVIGAALALGFVYLRLPQPTHRQALWGQRQTFVLQDAFLFALLGVGMAVLLDILGGRLTNAYLTEPELLPLYWEARLYQQALPFGAWLLAALLMVIAQPAAEEVILRGIVQPVLRYRLGAWPGYLLTAALSAALHGVVYSVGLADASAGWYGWLAPFLAALLFGGVKIYTGTTRAACFAHVGFGLFALLKLLTLVG